MFALSFPTLLLKVYLPFSWQVPSWSESELYHVWMSLVSYSLTPSPSVLPPPSFLGGQASCCYTNYSVVHFLKWTNCLMPQIVIFPIETYVPWFTPCCAHCNLIVISWIVTKIYWPSIVWLGAGAQMPGDKSDCWGYQYRRGRETWKQTALEINNNNYVYRLEWEHKGRGATLPWKMCVCVWLRQEERIMPAIIQWWVTMSLLDVRISLWLA